MKAMQASCINQHSKTTLHRIASKAFLQPDKAVTEFLPYQMEDQTIMTGNVPQPEDWLRVWRLCLTPTSFAAAEAAYATEHVINPIRKCPNRRRSLRSMVQVMAEVVRKRKRETIQRSLSISIALDDRKDYRLVRFRCDLAADAEEGRLPDAKKPANSGGLLAVFRPSLTDGTSLSEQDNDKSQKMADSVVQAIRRFCTVPDGQGGRVDEELVQCFLDKCRHTTADQGTSAQKSSEILAGTAMPNVIIVGRDPAHQVRIASRDPLHTSAAFKPVWDKLFGGRHAVVPEIKNSEAWRSCLIACQKTVIELDGQQGGRLKTVLRHLAFAQQRFESYSDPVTRFCCMIKAIAYTLAMKAADARRKKEDRARAASALRSLSAEELMGLAVSADYAEETVAFLRRFDKYDHDPAKTPAQLREFTRRMRLLFCDGHIMCEPSRPCTVKQDSQNGQDDDDGSYEPKTITQIVWEQVQDPEPIGVGPELFFLSTRATPAQIRGKMQAMCDVVDLMLDRLHADLASGLSGTLDAFDLAGWRASSASQSDGPAVSSTYRDKVTRLVHALKLGRQWDVGQFGKAARALTRHAAAQDLITNTQVDNRVAWSWLLRPRMRQEICPALQWSPELQMLIAFYVSMVEGTGDVERQLGRMVTILKEHSGPLREDGETVHALLEVQLDGPKKESDMFYKDSEGGTWCMTEFSRECQSLYIQLHGRRFSYTYQVRSAARRSDPGYGMVYLR